MCALRVRGVQTNRQRSLETYAEAFALRIRLCSRDLVRATLFLWMMFFEPARSSFFAARRNSSSALAMSPACTASRTLRICVRTEDLSDRLRFRRTSV